MFQRDDEEYGPELREVADEFDLFLTHLECHPQKRPFRLFITDDRDPRLFRIDSDRGVLVSTYESDGICRYAGMGRNDYFRLCALLGKIQWTVLQLNPLLVEEDFSHVSPSPCLYAPRPFKQDFALALENPQICPGCLDFYRCLGAETEILALRMLLDELHSTHP
ncbi:MAG: hypothetical protein KJ060_18120 [Candidatus Hydrogenedentes bacterium]|nr:hypothetical protein [Candidatus Hydrogenedentota bacterium]